MPVAQRIAVPKVKHFGFYFDIRRGFADIADAKNMPAPGKTKLARGIVSGIATYCGQNSLYCITNGNQEELVVTFYEQLSGLGEMLYLYENSKEFFIKNSKFLSKIDTSKPHRLFATFTGGNSILASRVANFITLKLKEYEFQRIVWNTWSWLPQSFSFCLVKNYVVRLDLITGDVKSFATTLSQVELFFKNTEFVTDNRFAVRDSIEKWLR